MKHNRPHGRFLLLLSAIMLRSPHARHKGKEMKENFEKKTFFKPTESIKDFRNENGHVSLERGNQSYIVDVLKYTGPDSKVYRIRSQMSLIEAEEFYENAIRYINGEIKWTEPVRNYCFYDTKKSCACCAANCPSSFGGEAYWNIFARSCLHRISRSR